MKKIKACSILGIIMTKCIDTRLLPSAEQGRTANSNYAQLQHSLKELSELKQELTTCQQQIEILNKTNSCQRQRLIRFARKLAQAHYLGHYDELTGLPNRRLLLDRFKQAMAQSDRQRKQIALLFIDVDKFKGINDRTWACGRR